MFETWLALKWMQGKWPEPTFESGAPLRRARCCLSEVPPGFLVVVGPLAQGPVARNPGASSPRRRLRAFSADPAPASKIQTVAGWTRSESRLRRRNALRNSGSFGRLAKRWGSALEAYWRRIENHTRLGTIDHRAPENRRWGATTRIPLRLWHKKSRSVINSSATRGSSPRPPQVGLLDLNTLQSRQRLWKLWLDRPRDVTWHISTLVSGMRPG